MKKILLNKTYLLLSLLLSFSFVSCLEDKGFKNGEYQTINANVLGQEWISIPLAARQPNALGVESKTGFQAVPLFPVSYDFADPAPQDITITLAVNNSLVAQQAPTAVVLPSSSYNVPSTTITIPAGKRVSDYFTINMNTSTLDPSKSYAIGFSITGVSKAGVGIPSNMKDVVFVFTIKNKYDGIYTFIGKYDHPADRDPAWRRDEWTYAYDVQLRTTGPNSVTFFNEAFGSGFLPLMVPGVSGFGATALDIVFDANDKVVSVNNPTPDSRNRQFALIPGGNSRYDAATKTLYLEMVMTQNGFAPIPMHIRMVYKKPRP